MRGWAALAARPGSCTAGEATRRAGRHVGCMGTRARWTAGQERRRCSRSGTEAGVRGRARGGDSGAEYLGGDGEEAMAAEIKKRPSVGGGRGEERSGYIYGDLQSQMEPRRGTED
jgi:hypothetical protein